MKTITQYLDEIKALMKRVADIDAVCVAENREPSETELAIKNEMMDAVEETRKLVATLERQERISAALERPADPVTKPSPANPRITAVDRPKDRFGSFGEQMAAVMRAGVPGGSVDPRLFTAGATGLNETTPSDGGLI